MNGLHQIRDAVIRTLESGGITAIPAYAGTAKQYVEPVTAVSVSEAAGKPSALCSYLGERWDEDTCTMQELYGRRLEVTIALEIRALDADSCESTMETVAELLIHSLPSGLRCGELSWNPVVWDQTNRVYLRAGKFCCQAYFIAESDGDSSTAFLEFILKGVLQS